MILKRLFKRKTAEKKYNTQEEAIVAFLLSKGHSRDIILETCADEILGLNQDLVTRGLDGDKQSLDNKYFEKSKYEIINKNFSEMYKKYSFEDKIFKNIYNKEDKKFILLK